MSEYRNQHIDSESMLLTSPGWSKTSDDYARYRAGFPDVFFERAEARGLFARGARCLDLGTGTGTLALGMARRGASVVGLDVEQGQLEAAKKRAFDAKLDVRFALGAAESTGLESESFDTVSAGQCWHWFNRAAAAKEARRLLKMGGKIFIAHLDYIESEGSIAAGTADLIQAILPRPNAGHSGHQVNCLYPAWIDDLLQAGFRDVETWSLDVPVEYTHEAWRGRMRASQWVAGAEDPSRVAAFDSALAAWLKHHAPDPMNIQHRIFVAQARA